MNKRNAAEKALREVTERLNLALYAASMGTWSWDIVANDAASIKASIWDEHMWPLFGLPVRKKPTLVSWEKFLACIHNDDRERVRKEVFENIKETDFYHIEYRVVWPDGSIHWLAERGRLYRNEQGELKQVAGVCQDITPQKIAQEKLRESEQKLRSIVETTNEWIWAVDLAGYITYSNPMVETILGHKPEELLGKHYLNFRYKEDVLLTPLTELAANKQGWNNLIIRTLHKDGNYRYLESSAVVSLSPTGEVIGYRGADRDITERIKAEAHLKDLSERLNLALDAATVGTWCWDIQADKLNWDAHMRDLFAINSTIHEGTFAEFLAYVHPDDRSVINIKTQRAMKGKEKNIEFEHRLIWPDSSVHVIATRGKIYRDTQGRPLRIAGASYDVTARRRAEQRLRDSEEKYRSIVETTSEWIWEIDAQGRHTYNNPALFRMLGYRPSEILGKTCLPYVHDDDREWLAKSLPFHIETKTGWNNVIVRWRHKEGGYRYLESSAVPVISEAGEVKGFRGADRDITLRRQVEQSLEELSERLNLALNAASMGNWSWNIADDVVTWSDYMYQLYGMEFGSFKGGHEAAVACIYVEDQEYVRQEILKAIHENMSFDIEHRVQWPDNSIHFIATRGKVYRDEHDKAVRLTGVSWDITARKQTEQLGRQHQIELAHVARINSMGEMASTLAHELNQPLAAIANYAKGCVRRLESGNFQLDQILHAMRQAALQSERAGEIIHRMKNFVRKGSLYYEAADINKIIRNMATLINYEMREFPVALKLELAEQLPLLPVDKVQIEQVILNLLRNAIEAMQEAKTIKPTLLIRTSLPNNESMHVDVIDNGPGFSVEIGQQLLTPYFTTKPKGMGMGLAICRTIIEAHGGHLSARINLEGGAWFQFTLPVTNIEIV